MIRVMPRSVETMGFLAALPPRQVAAARPKKRRLRDGGSPIRRAGGGRCWRWSGGGALPRRPRDCSSSNCWRQRYRMFFSTVILLLCLHRRLFLNAEGNPSNTQVRVFVSHCLHARPATTAGFNVSCRIFGAGSGRPEPIDQSDNGPVWKP